MLFRSAAGLFAETAHPVKFFDVVEPVIGRNVPLPEAIASIMHKEKVAVSMNADYQSLRAYLQGL